MQYINQSHLIGLQADLTTLADSFKRLSQFWANDESLKDLTIDQVRINPLVAEQHATTIRGVTVVQSSDVPVGKIQLVAVMLF